MSGKRQHYIPQFLQEGFASHKSGDEIFTWVYRKDRPPFNSNIVNVGVEGFFYTYENDTLVDDNITEAEGTLSELVKTLRESMPTTISDPKLPGLIAHFEIRTRHFRQNFLQTGDYIVSRFIDFIADQESFTNYLLRKYQADPSLMRKYLLEALSKRGVPQNMRESMIQMCKPYIPVVMNQLKAMLPKIATDLRAIMPKQLREAAKSGHIRGLKDVDSTEVRIKKYKDFEYTIADVPDSNLILGDSIVIFQVEGQTPYKTFLNKDTILKAVFLPLSPRRVLIGAREGNYSCPPDLQQAIARCSLEYFIAHKNCDVNSSLKEYIGEYAPILTKEQLEEIIEDVMKQ